MVLSGRLPPGEMYPAGEADVRARFVALASGLNVRVVEAGFASSPPIMLVPGWACTAWIYHRTLPALAQAGFRAIAVELKGHGLSDKPTDPAEYTVESMRDHLIGILDALSIPVAGFVGHSMGGAVVAHAAAAAPDRVSRLAMVAPVGFAGVPGMSLFRTLTPEAMVPFLPYMASRLLVKAMLQVVYGDIVKPTERDVEEFRAPTQFPEFTRALRNLLHRFDWEAKFPGLAVPHMVIAGTKDHLSPPSQAPRYGGENTALVVEGAGHVLFSEAPDVVNPALASFFRGWAQPGYI